MNVISYRTDMNLVLMVKDTNGFDGFAVFLDGEIAAPPVDDGLLHRYDVPRPTKKTMVAVRFGGNDGGATGIFNVAEGKRDLLETEQGKSHVYVIEPG